MIHPAFLLLALAACHNGPEVCTDGIDNDGDALVDCDDADCATAEACTDADADGWVATEDCDDLDPGAHPGADEVCDGDDNDCDGAIDEGDATDAAVYYADADGDGYGDQGVSAWACTQPSGYVEDDTDCDDDDPLAFPGSTETCDPGDDDCDGLVDEDDPDLAGAPTWYLDHDGDGYGVENDDYNQIACAQPEGFADNPDDCDDTDANVNPGVLWYADADGDGYGDPAVVTAACYAPSGYVADATDCDDTDASVNPGVPWYADADGDGYGDPAVSTAACYAPSGMVADDTDCDDTAADVYPGADEWCDGVDHDCDGLTDEDSSLDAPTWYADADGDGYGDAASSQPACDQPSGYVADATDCDDTDASVNPGVVWYADADGDGWGDAAISQLSCLHPSGHVLDATDCDDGAADIFPGADEWCDGTDHDCDGLVDEDHSLDATTWYADADADGYGDAAASLAACSQPSGYVDDASDCDDSMDDVFPGADEWCDGVDHDCDGLTDEDHSLDADTWYADADGDGYGDAASIRAACSQPSGFVTDATDCDDGDAAVNPGAEEVCNNSLDDDCDADPGDCTFSQDQSLAAADAKLTGITEQERAGISLAAAGDVDSDGYDDILVGGYDSTGSVPRGVAYLVRGPIGAGSLASLGVSFSGEADLDDFGRAVSSAGDVDGDGYADILLAARKDATGGAGAGAVYLLYEPVTATSLTDADAKFTGDAGDAFGTSLASAGDVDGDGYDDLLIGAHTDDLGTSTGSAWLVYGPVDNGVQSVDGYELRGESAGDLAGGAVAGGDLDGDGLGDLVIGAELDDDGGYDAGAAYVVYGPVTGAMSLAAADAKLTGAAARDSAGISVAGSGDTDGDGYDDILVGAYHNDDAGSDAGAAYLVPGPVTSGTLGSAGVALLGEAAGDLAGISVASVGDTDADGYDDLLIGAEGQDGGGTEAGAAYLVLGPMTAGVASLGDADARFTGEWAWDRAGNAVAGAGDTDGDGYPDLLVGAYGNDAIADASGAAYLILGLGL